MTTKTSDDRPILHRKVYEKITGKENCIYRLTVNGVTGYLPVIYLPVTFPRNALIE